MNIFMLSNGKLPNSTTLLDYAMPALSKAFRAQQVQNVLVIPYAVIRLSYAERLASVREAFAGSGLELDIHSIDEYDDPVSAVAQADAILVSGGNTWYLNKALHDQGLNAPIRRAVLERGAIYAGWSAGAVICAPNMCTTNDMCIVDAAITDSLNFVPFHLNAHYLDARIANHTGETRDERILEFCLKNPHKTVIGIPEGSWLHLGNHGLSYHVAAEDRPLICFRCGEDRRAYSCHDDITHLMQC